MSASQNVAVTLPDGRRLDVPPGTRIADLDGAAKDAIAARVDGVPVDLAHPLDAEKAAVSFVKPDDVDALHAALSRWFDEAELREALRRGAARARGERRSWTAAGRDFAEALAALSRLSGEATRDEETGTGGREGVR